MLKGLRAVAMIGLLAALPVQADAPPNKRTSFVLPLPQTRLVNYYSLRNNWSNMWTNWDPATINSDFALIAGSLRANTVRIILQADTFGWPPAPIMLQRLSQMIDLAEANNLHVQLTLFDWWSAYASDPTASASGQWANAVLAPFAGDPRIAFVELQNEIDPADPAAMQWARLMIPYLKTMLRGTPVTVSTTGDVGNLSALIASLGTSQPDFYDHHLYLGCDSVMAYRKLQELQTIVKGAPLFIGETGLSSYPATVAGCNIPAAGAEAYQDFYLRNLQYAAASLGIPAAAPWAFIDFWPGSIPGQASDDDQYHFGLLRTDYSLKPAASSTQALFASGTASGTQNYGFEQDAGGIPAEWSLYHPSEGSFARDTAVAHSGAASARISASSGDSSGLPGFYTTPISSAAATIQPGASYSASVWAKGQNATGSTFLAIAWYSETDQWLGNSRSADLPAGTTPWTLLQAQGTAPTGAAYVRIYLYSSYNSGTSWFDDVSFGPAN